MDRRNRSSSSAIRLSVNLPMQSLHLTIPSSVQLHSIRGFIRSDSPGSGRIESAPVGSSRMGPDNPARTIRVIRAIRGLFRSRIWSDLVGSNRIACAFPRTASPPSVISRSGIFHRRAQDMIFSLSCQEKFAIISAVRPAFLGATRCQRKDHRTDPEKWFLIVQRKCGSIQLDV